jgi:hypothetical protein
MRELSSADFLNLWERGWAMHSLDRGVLALAAALPDSSCDSLADWPLGRRNSALAELRCGCFGRWLEGWISCPKCAERLEFQMDVRTLIHPDPSPAASIAVNGRSFRLPTSRDLAAVANQADPLSAATELAKRCRLDAGAPADWRDDELEEIGERMALADPMAETRLKFECSECGYAWEESFDIAAFFWTEVEARARRLLLDVHKLAARYGWPEQQILALSEHRRAIYLEMARE